MADKFVIEITGTLPEKDKYAILARAQTLANELAGQLKDDQGVDATVAVRAVRHKVVAAKPNGASVAADNVHVSSSEAGHG